MSSRTASRPGTSLVRTVRRGVRTLRRLVSTTRARFVYHDLYGRTLSAAPLDPQRGKRVLAFLLEEKLLRAEDIAVPRQPALRNLLRVHTAAYLDSLQRTEVATRIFGTAVTDGELEKIVETQRLAVGGTIQATRLALRHGGIVFNLGGGFHHAERSAGLGFCIFHDVAVAVSRLRARGFRGPVLVVDLDMHDGNGTRSIFADDPTVHTYSVHAEHWGPTAADASTSIELGIDVGDEQFLETLFETLPRVVEKVRPSLVFYVAGTDPAADDAIGTWRLSAQAMLTRDRFVVELVRAHGHDPPPIVVVLAGGYGTSSWRYTARFASWAVRGRTIEPPETDDLTLARFRRIGRHLDRAELTSEPGGFSWSLTDEDLAGIIPGVERNSRFLGYFSRHGVELVLERFGILDQLRVRGYNYPQIEVDASAGLGQTLRIYGAPSRQELLIELRVRRSKREVEDAEVLIVEWLLAQDPRAEFGPLRRPLPGQKHPGLGMLKEILGWLVVVAEMLDLDAVYFVPSSYHVAAQSRRTVRFLVPEHEARFRALVEAVGSLRLAGASRAVAGGAVIDSRTGRNIEWDGYPMVIPVSEQMRRRVTSEEYEARVEAELERVAYRLEGSRSDTVDEAAP